MHVDASIIIGAPKPMVAAIFADWRNWPHVFPTIRGVRLIREDGEKQVLEVDHVEGVVPNELVAHLPDAVDLFEVKRRYDALFLNRFDTVPGGTRYTVHGVIRLKGVARLLRPVLAPYVRRQIERWTLEPVKIAAEASVSATSSPDR